MSDILIVLGLGILFLIACFLVNAPLILLGGKLYTLLDPYIKSDGIITLIQALYIIFSIFINFLFIATMCT